MRAQSTRAVRRRADVALGLILVVATLAAYSPVVRNDFVDYDDHAYVTENPEVKAGLTARGIVWAFTTFHASNWHPLTWISHMLDVSLFGMNPGLHHLTSLLLHAATSLLLFLVLGRMTGLARRSAFVAALFALHPLHVESVAWIAERKDVLCGFFFVLMLGAYALYAEKPSPARHVATLLLYALGLLAKPMLVTVPFVLLLLDRWPLRRGLRLLEKVPFLVLAAASSGVTFLAQHRGGAVTAAAELTLPLRIENALLSYARYLGKTLWPHDLAVFYPYPLTWTAAQVAGAVGIVAGITTLAIVLARRHPWLVTGWLIFLGMLVPVLGLVQVGAQSMADRYTYLPHVGLFLVAAWGAAEAAERIRIGRVPLGLAAGSILAALALLTFRQVRTWRDTVTLFEHALRVTDRNFLAHEVLGKAMAEQGRFEDAIRHDRESAGIRPSSEVENDLGVALAKLGRLDEAAAAFTRALALDPTRAATAANLAEALAKLGRTQEALARYADAVRLAPEKAAIHNSYGAGLLAMGRLDEALVQYREAVRLDPALAAAHDGLGVALALGGRNEEALLEYREAVRLDPSKADFRYNLGTALLSVGQRTEAAAAFTEAVRLAPGHAAATRALQKTRGL